MLYKVEDQTTKLLPPDPPKRYRRVYVDYAEVNRNTRNQLLSDSDWTQMPDSPLTDEAKALWVTYRTSLRDLTAHENWPKLAGDDWPTAP
jgi:hypothetical protein